MDEKRKECWGCEYLEKYAHECRRYPPQATRTDGGAVVFFFPSMGAGDWCGEFKEKRDEQSDNG